MTLGIELKGSSILISGPLFERDAKRKLRRNISVIVKEIAEEGAGGVRARVLPQNATGQTRAGVEAHLYGANSMWAKVRMKPELRRSPDSTGGRRPYIIAAVLESGAYGGHKVTTVRFGPRGARRRSTWKRGGRRQKPLWMFRDTYREMKARAFGIVNRGDLTRGLE